MSVYNYLVSSAREAVRLFNEAEDRMPVFFQIPYWMGMTAFAVPCGCYHIHRDEYFDAIGCVALGALSLYSLSRASYFMYERAPRQSEWMGIVS